MCFATHHAAGRQLNQSLNPRGQSPPARRKLPRGRPESGG